MYVLKGKIQLRLEVWAQEARAQGACGYLSAFAAPAPGLITTTGEENGGIHFSFLNCTADRSMMSLFLNK